MLINDGKVRLIGDPHFGKPFNGTPIHRRGDRERMQMEQFREELNGGEELVVMVGDLFDRPFVPLPLVHDVAQAVRDAAANNGSTFVMMAGNHDRSRQLGTKAAWELFTLAVNDLPNVRCLDCPSAIQGCILFPWQWDMSALEQAQRYGSNSCDFAIGHWDLQDFGGDTTHMVPVAELRSRNPHVEIYSGHYHLPGDYEVDGVTVHCTGSMQPYAHGEGDMYVTLTAAEALERDDLRDKCVRLILEPGEAVPSIDCLQLNYMREDSSEQIEIEVSIGDFSMAQALEEEFTQYDVPQDVRNYITERMGAAS